jgi:hypothetical protein
MKIKDYKKKYAICKDSQGKMIYWWDLVEVWNPTEKTSRKIWWCKIIVISLHSLNQLN